MPFSQLSQMQPGEPSAAIRERVIADRTIRSVRSSTKRNHHQRIGTILPDSLLEAAPDEGGDEDGVAVGLPTAVNSTSSSTRMSIRTLI